MNSDRLCSILANWERGACVLPRDRSLLSTNDAFSLLCRFGELWTKRSRPGLIAHFGTDRGEVVFDATVFPSPKDRTFGNYANRLTSELARDSFLLYLRGLGHHASVLQRRAAARLAPLRSAGLSWEHMDIEIYLGRYDWTPIGIHRESCGNVHEVVLGTKELLVWPAAALLPDQARADLARGGRSRAAARRAGLLKRVDCSVHRARAGAAIYFPSGCWHVGASPELSVSLDLALYGVRSR
jgi:hypothetical protein